MVEIPGVVRLQSAQKLFSKPFEFIILLHFFGPNAEQENLSAYLHVTGAVRRHSSVG